VTAEEEIHLVTVSNVVGRGLSLQGITTDGSRPPRSDRGTPFPGLAALAAIAGAGDSRLEIFSPSRQRSVAKREAMGQARTDWNRIISINALYRGKQEDL